MTTHKTCSRCKVLKPVSEFFRRAAMRDGYKSNCRQCGYASRRAWVKRNKSTEYAHVAEWRRNNPDKVLRLHLKRLYGITLEQFSRIMERQCGCCAICGTAFTDEVRPHVDHCHESGDVRGILCRDCNLGLGKFSDNPERLRAAAAYVNAARNILRAGAECRPLVGEIAA